MSGYLAAPGQVQSSRHQRWWFVLVVLAAVMLYELASFSSFGLLGFAYWQYPHVHNVPIWLGKHVLITTGVLGWMGLLARARNVLSGRRLIRRISSFVLFAMGALLFAVAVEWGKGSALLFPYQLKSIRPNFPSLSNR